MHLGNLIMTDQQAVPTTEENSSFVYRILADVMDPEVPIVSVIDLGIVRDVYWIEGRLHVLITPTYSGCPATAYIEMSIREALIQSGFIKPNIVSSLSPAWTTDWITDEGREKLRAYGVSPPVGSGSKPSLDTETPIVSCPMCSSINTEEVSEFGSTACKALYRCHDCLEPFDYFKCI